ncbi:MAG TPA: diacylglycerol kinase family protein [Gemmatimonadaceae bacterium]|nr:diacylglycerol kinase family protein [Gemmatimonadaceae bacterium]
MSHDVCVVVNPASGRGRGSRILPEVRRAFQAVGVSDVRVSSAPGDERALARQAIADGRDTLVAVGGDGTWSNVAGAILESGADCRLALLAGGTGNDFAKTVGAPCRDVHLTARLATEGGGDVRMDVGRIEHRHFLNVAGFGFDIAVLEDIARIRWLRGPALYYYSALRQLARFRGVPIEVRSERGTRSARHLMLIVANAQRFGGSFHIAPRASLTDGMLDAISIHDAPVLRRLQLFRAAGAGAHTAMPEVTAEQASAFRLRFAAPPAYETDGEYHVAESAELEVRCVPGALRVVTGAEPGAA